MKKPFADSNTIITNKISLLFAIPLLLLVSGSAFIGSNYTSSKKEIVPEKKQEKLCDNSIQIFSDKNSFELTKPMIIVEVAEQSPSLFTLKKQISDLSDAEFANKNLNDISIYLMKQNTGEWIGLNYDEPYNSSGYIRFAILITYLKMAEKDPLLLNRTMSFHPENSKVLKDTSLELKDGNYYTVKELLQKMILFPDTNSRYLLAQQMDMKLFNSLFTILGMNIPNVSTRKYSINVAQYSRFLQLLYNGRYLNETHSEYALQLLSDQTDKKGILKLLPTNTKALHKISERYVNNSFELRESGIIYSESDSYLLTIFARGDNKEQLDSISGKIARVVYDHINM
jgi:beta-lactamase class A